MHRDGEKRRLKMRKAPGVEVITAEILGWRLYGSRMDAQNVCSWKSGEDPR